MKTFNSRVPKTFDYKDTKISIYKEDTQDYGFVGEDIESIKYDHSSELWLMVDDLEYILGYNDCNGIYYTKEDILKRYTHTMFNVEGDNIEEIRFLSEAGVTAACLLSIEDKTAEGRNSQDAIDFIGASEKMFAECRRIIINQDHLYRLERTVKYEDTSSKFHNKHEIDSAKKISAQLREEMASLGTLDILK